MTGLKKLGVVLGLVAAALALASLIVLGHDPQEGAALPGGTGLPWQVDVLDTGATRVFGLTLSTRHDEASTLADVQRRWPQDVQLAVMAAPGEAGTLEAYVESATMGPIAGKLVVTVDADASTVQRLRQEAIGRDVIEGGTFRFRVSARDARVLGLPILALSFIPQAQLDEALITSRFGSPAQRVRSDERQEHWLYPARGLAITLDSQGKDLLQYVAPARFDRLSTPLLRKP